MPLSRLALLFTLLLPLPSLAEAVLHHRLAVTLMPDRHQLQVMDTLSWPSAPSGPLEFDLHAGLAPEADGGASLTRIAAGEDSIPFERFRLQLAPGARSVMLRYGGTIHHPLGAFGQGVGQRSEASPGLIDAEGVFLSAASGWFPLFASHPRHTFELVASLPEGWWVVSQGARKVTHGATVHWQETNPQQELYLIAGRFTEYQSREDATEVLVYLRRADPALAERYLAATHRYLRLFSTLLGDYPYAKFALVENFWETGYGMPSFTLLGPRVIRLPFILDSAYPHEIVHNWWGNGVYSDARRGNWSEGLTAYLADHLLKESAGRGAEYRRDQLQKYATFVSESADFPLARFRGRHSGATQAVGYGKGLMLFHMLRLELGDAAFLNGLRRFYRERRFRNAAFADLRMAFEAESGRDLGELFEQWVDRGGAPRLELHEAEFAPTHLSLHLAQTQAEAPFRLSVPLAIRLADGQLIERMLTMNERRTRQQLTLPGQPVCVAVDPRFDLFRRLLPGELPASLDALLGAERLLLVLPTEAAEPLRAAYRQLAQGWATRQPSIEVIEDRELQTLPNDRPVWLLGWQNRHLDALREALPHGTLAEGQVVLDENTWPRQANGIVLSAERRGQPIGWLGADDPVAIGVLARKVPHYGRYGYLVFGGAAADNQVKGQWPAVNSPLRARTGSADCQPEPRAPLARFAVGEGDSAR